MDEILANCDEARDDDDSGSGGINAFRADLIAQEENREDFAGKLPKF